MKQPTNNVETMRRRLKRWSLWLGLWTLIGFTFAAVTYAQFISMGREVPVAWWDHLKWMLVQYYIWGALTPLIARLARRFPLEREHWPRSLIVYPPAAVLFIAAWTFIFVTIYAAFDAPLVPSSPHAPPPTYARLLRNVFITRFTGQSLPAFLLILIAVQAAAFYRRFREEQLRASELKAHLADAQLQSLRTQLHPHFLFNTLNAISELIYKDEDRAERTITQLSDLLRLSLKGGQAQEVKLKEELDFLRKYIEIQQTLLQERLAVRWKVPDDLLDARVPNMILQPLVENAIRHGLTPRAAGGTIEISARREDGMLRLEVQDDGLGLKPGAPPADDGIGLANTRARLRHLYGEGHEFELRDRHEGRGLLVALSIPYREGGAEEHDEVSHVGR